ncbi:MAG: hypothetical protein NTW97_06620 [Candidatus Krumholzibacteria bacterium]|nr:hypothetical protein [Candidatus Krumholzibacteria bacterium]
MKRALSMMALCGCAVVALCLCAAVTAGAAFAQSPGRLVSKGNKQYDRKDFAKAIELYDRASVKAPESAIVAFNKGERPGTTSGTARSRRGSARRTATFRRRSRACNRA